MRCLIVTADDLGRDILTNDRILRSHTEGIVTAASLMVHELGADDAVARVRSLPDLDVGLHLTLSEGRGNNAGRGSPRLADADGRFRSSPARAGLAYFFRRSLRAQIQREVRLQFERFAATGLRCSHVDGHQHLHVHPVIWRALVECCGLYGVPWVRIPVEPWHAGRGVPAGRRLEWLALRALGQWCRRDARRQGLRFADHVYGHIYSGNMDERRLLETISRLRGSVSEVYLHPGASDEELAASLSARVRDAIVDAGIRLAGFTGTDHSTADGTA